MVFAALGGLWLYLQGVLNFTALWDMEKVSLTFTHPPSLTEMSLI